MHPHQIDVALFAFKSPLSKGALLADIAALKLVEKQAGRKQTKALEVQRNQNRRSLFDAQEEVDRQDWREVAAERVSFTSFFIRWSLP